MEPHRPLDTRGLQRWAGLAQGADQADIVIAGLPYDGSAVYRTGAAQAPERIRRLSAVIPPVTERGQSLAGLRVLDMADFEIGPRIESGWEAAAAALGNLPEAFLTVLGGDHCSAIPVLAAQRARHPDLALLWFDAHPDLCNSSRGGRWTCGCALRRGLEVSGLEPSSVMIAGSRDYDPEELEFAQAQAIALLSIRELAADPAGSGAAVAARFAGRPLHVSLDIDVLDPAFAPGTEVPSAGGLSTRQALDFLAAIAAGSRLVGLDMMEVCPPADPTDITILAALKLIFEVWGYVLGGR